MKMVATNLSTKEANWGGKKPTSGKENNDGVRTKPPGTSRPEPNEKKKNRLKKGRKRQMVG